MKQFAIAVLILATLCSFAAAEPKYTYGYTAIQSESRIPDPFDFLGVEAVYMESYVDEYTDTIDIYAYPCSGEINAPLLFADYADYATSVGCYFIGIESEYASFAKDDMVFILSVYEDDPETMYLAVDSRLTIGGI